MTGFQNLFEKVVELCEEENTRVVNLRDGKYASDELQQHYNTLMNTAEKREDISSVKVERELARNVSLDPHRLQKFGLWDIDVIQKDSLVFEEYPEINDSLENGLLEVEQPTDFNKDGFGYGNHYLIFCNPLRRNFRLSQRLFQRWDGSFCLSVCPSLDKLGLPNTEQETFLKEWWNGPQSLDKVRDSIEPEQLATFGNSKRSFKEGIQDRTEFHFTNRGDEWVLEIEELLPRRSVLFERHHKLRGQEIRYYTRYVHAITDEQLSECYHLDGALREYSTADKFIERHRDPDCRLNSDWAKDVTNRYKIFKLDADADPIPDYQELIGLFLKGNPHVKEFFEGESTETREQEEKRATHFEHGFEDYDLHD